MKIEEFKKLDPDFQQYLISMLENLTKERLIEYAPKKDTDQWLKLWQKEITQDTSTRKRRVKEILKELEQTYLDTDFISNINKVDMTKFAKDPIVKKAVKYLDQMKISTEWMHKNGFSTAVWLYGEAIKIK